MVFHLPNEDSLRMTNNYSEMFALTILWNIGLLGILIAFLFILCYILKKYQLRIQQNEILKDSMLTAEERSSRNLPTNQVNISVASQNQLTVKSTLNPTTKVFKVINILTSIFYYLLWIIITLIYVGFYMFNFFGRGTYIDVLSVFAITLAVVIPTLIWKYYTKASPLAQSRGEIIATVVLLSIWLGISVFMVVISKGACLCYFNDRYGFLVDKDLSLSTDFTRLVTLDQVCNDEEICHLYATVPQDPSTAVFFNAHSGLSLSNLTFILTKGQTIINQQTSNISFKLQNVQSIGQRYIHSILITDLTPNTLYTLQIQDLKGKSLKKTTYKTTPGLDATEVRIAAGGDIGMTQYGQLMVSYLKYFNPDIIIIGGDTVYDNGLRSCYYSWDNFYSMFEPVYQHFGRLIPLVMTIGNHDVGYDALNPVNIDLTDQAIPLFFAFNPQHQSTDGKSVPKILERQSYHYHLIGPTIHFNLDSGYIKGYKDQISFVQNNIRTYPKYYRFANYHNPIFPSCTDSTPGSNDVQVIENGKKYWVPLFDKWSFTAVLQHHTHHRKMTYLLKNSAPNEEGTRYIGDGSWGVTNVTCKQNQIPSYIGLMEDYQKNDAPNHFWQIVLTPTKDSAKPYSISYTAIDMGRKPVVQKTDNLSPVKDEL